MSAATDARKLELPRPIARARMIVLISFSALIVYFAALSIYALGGLKPATLVIWLVQVLPLLIFARSLYLTHLRTYGWLCFVVLLYFLHAVLVAFDPSRRLFGLIEVSLCVTLFVALVLFIRGYKDHFQVNM
ncbi:MAG: DUF2069 domain-containing protein [Pseudohongiellaceae bacterium]